MCSSTLSVNCEKAEKATQRYPDCRSPYFAAVAGLWSAPGYPRERGDSQEGGNRRCLPSCAPARRQRRFRSLRKRLTPDGTIIKIDKYPQKGYTNLTRGYGGIGRRARFRFWCPRRAGSSPVTRTSKKTLWNLSTAFFFCRFLLGQLALCLLLKALLGYDGALVRALTDQTCLIVCGNLEGKHLAVRRDLG